MTIHHHTPTVTRLEIPGDTHNKMIQTIGLVGKAIENASTYLPLRNHAAALATLARPKDYLGQVREIYKNAIRKWRYVNDPWKKELLTHSPKALWNLVLAGDGKGVGLGYGAGDCDCIAAAVGAQLQAIGRPVRIAVTAPPNAPPGRSFTHIFVQAQVPHVGWVTVDPVVHPKHGFGHTPKHSRIAFFSLSGQLLGHTGNVVGLSGFGSIERSTRMHPGYTQWQDYGLGGTEGYEVESNTAPEDWRHYGLDGFGAYSEMLGTIAGEPMGLLAEVDVDLYGNRVLARTPMIDISPEDYRYVQVMRRPYDGMMGVADDGQLYAYDGTLGFFKKLFRRVKKRVKKVVRRVRKGIRKVVRKIPGGKYLIKLGKKIHKIAKKFVKPLVKFVGKYAAKLAPVAALIPGYGPAIAGALYSAGKVANLMLKYGAKLKGAAGTVRKLTFPSGQNAKKFQAHLKKMANKEVTKRKLAARRPKGWAIANKLAKLSTKGRSPSFLYALAQQKKRARLRALAARRR